MTAPRQMRLALDGRDAPQEWTHDPVDRSGLAAYTHLIWGPDDPERSPRKDRKGQETAWRQRLDPSTQPRWRAAILELLADGEPRTFNRLMVELADMEASLAFGMAPDVALWELVAEGRLEHTLEAPIFFRLR